jgi:hypothetical protein
MPQQIDGYPSKPHKQANELRAQKAKVKKQAALAKQSRLFFLWRFLQNHQAKRSGWHPTLPFVLHAVGLQTGGRGATRAARGFCKNFYGEPT